MTMINEMLSAHARAGCGFHGYLVSVGEVAAFLVERISRRERIPDEMYTPAGADALVKLLLGWDLVRVRDHSPGAHGKDVTDNKAYLDAPAWLREMLKNTHRLGTSISANPAYDGSGHISSLVPGLHDWRDNPIEFEATCDLIASEIDVQFAEILPDRPRPTAKHMAPEGHYDGCFIVDFGRIDGRLHQDTIKVVGGQHASLADIALRVSEMRRNMGRRLQYTAMIGEGIDAVQAHVEKKISGLAGVALADLRVSGLSIDHDDQGVAVNVVLDAPDHALNTVKETFLTWATKHGPSDPWTMSSHQMPRIMSRLRRTVRTGSILTADSVVASVLSALDGKKRDRLLDAVFEVPGQPLEGVSLNGTGMKRLRLHHGTLGGTVEITEGVTWVDGALRVRRKVLELPETVIIALKGHPMSVVINHPLIPEAVITEVRQTGTAYRFVTDAKPIPFTRQN